MVGVARIELATPAMSTQCSTTELHAHSTGDLARPLALRKALAARFTAKLASQAVELGRHPRRDLALRRFDHRGPADHAGLIGCSHAEVGSAVPHHQLRGEAEVAGAAAANREPALAEVGDDQFARGS